MIYNKNNLAVASVASKDTTTQPAINGVLFTKDVTVATDNFKLLEVSTPKNANIDDFPALPNSPLATDMEPTIIDASVVNKVKIPVNKDLPILSNMALKKVNDDVLGLVTNDLDSENNINAQIIKEEYPDYKQIIPTNKPTVELKVNPQYLIDVLKVLKDVAKTNNSNNVTLKVYDDLTAIHIEANGNNQDATGLVMPINN